MVIMNITVYFVWRIFTCRGLKCRGLNCRGLKCPIPSFKMLNFRKIKKGRGCFCMSANLKWFKVCFLSSGGQYTSFGTPQAQCRTIFSKNSFSSNFANFNIFAIWAKFVPSGSFNTCYSLLREPMHFFWYPTCLP